MHKICVHVPTAVRSVCRGRALVRQREILCMISQDHAQEPYKNQDMREIRDTDDILI
jgi:hypothetical protein